MVRRHPCPTTSRVTVIGRGSVDADDQFTTRLDATPGSAYLLGPDQHICARWRHPTYDKIAAARLRPCALDRHTGIRIDASISLQALAHSLADLGADGAVLVHLPHVAFILLRRHGRRRYRSSIRFEQLAMTDLVRARQDAAGRCAQTAAQSWFRRIQEIRRSTFFSARQASARAVQSQHRRNRHRWRG